MTYLTEVIADAPLHFWRCADPGGALAHDLGSSPRALQIGAAQSPAILPYTGPNSDSGACFLGLGSALNYVDADLPLVLPITLECWFWLHHSSGAAADFLGVGDGAGVSVSIGVDATLHAHGFSSGGGLAAAAATNRQNWHHLVMTNTGATVLLYLDAIQVATIAAAALPAWSPGFVIGAGGNPGAPARFANAAIAECAVYGTALAAGRVTAHFVAADQVATRPVFRANGTFSTTSGTVILLPDQAAAILASVRKTY